MAIPESPIPPQMIAEIPKQLQMLVMAQRGTEAATLAAAVIAAMGRPISIAEALEIHRDVLYSLYTDHGTVAYQAWSKIKDQRLAKIHT